MNSRVKKALADLAQGKMVLLLDDESRENEGDLIVAAEKINLSSMQFLLKHTSGIVCVAMSEQESSRLGISRMVRDNRSKQGTPFGVSFEAASGISTGVSAQDRVRSIQVAAQADAKSQDIVMPGHIFPLIANELGVLKRAGHTEGSVDLMRLAGLKSMAVIAEVTLSDGSMARQPELTEFAKTHQITLLSVQDIIEYRWQVERLLQPTPKVSIPTLNHGEFDCQVFVNPIDGIEHVALTTRSWGETPLVRLHSECLTGDIFGSKRCDCGQQLERALAQIQQQGGALLYLRQEGRGIGLANKMHAYALQQQGMDTVEANHHLGFAADAREYYVAAQMCRELGLQQIRLLTNNPRKINQLNHLGVNVVDQVPLIITECAENAFYLKTKQQKLGHLLNLQ